MRPTVIAAATRPYPPPDANGPLHLLVFGGSQGASIMADIVPPAIGRLDAAVAMRLQDRAAGARGGYSASVRETYAALKVSAEIAPFFIDLPARMAAEPSGGLALRRVNGGGD